MYMAQAPSHVWTKSRDKGMLKGNSACIRIVLVQKGRHNQVIIADIKNILVLYLMEGFEKTTMYIPCIHLFR